MCFNYKLLKPLPCLLSFELFCVSYNKNAINHVFEFEVYQSIQEGDVVLQLRTTPTEELEQFLPDRLLHTQTVVISL